MKIPFKKTLFSIFGSGIIGGGAYFAFFNSSKELETPKINTISGPKWFNKLRNTEQSSLSDGMKIAQSFAKEGQEVLARNWVNLICNEERSNKPEEKEICDRQE